MNATCISRRRLLSSAALATGTSVLAGCGGPSESAPGPEATTVAEGASASQPAVHRGEGWKYVKLDPAAVAAEAYRLMPLGGCMYALFGGIMAAMARLQGEPYRSFPVHMTKYGEGGVGLWGSLCGTLNGGAAIIGLFVPQKEQRERLIAELFSWYEATGLPTYHPKDKENSPSFPKSVARSVLCHVSVGRWCAISGDEVGSPEMKERCRRLAADVAAKTVELLNASLREPCRFDSLSSEVKSCLSCHGKGQSRATLGQMQCMACHQRLPQDHPSVKAASSGSDLLKAEP